MPRSTSPPPPKPMLDPLPAFGKEMRSFFRIDPSYLILNNASFCALPKYVSEYFIYLHLCSEYHPERWMYYNAKGIYFNTLKRISPYLGDKDSSEITLSQNTTTSLNAVLRSFNFVSGDVIVRYCTTYLGCYNTISYICDTTDATCVDIPLTFPYSHQDIIDATREVIEKIQATPGKRLRFAIVDVFSSLPVILFPYKQLVSMFKNTGSRVFLDAAHAICHFELQIGNINCDYMSTNVHKWFYSKLGCSIFYIKKDLQHEVQPTAASLTYSTNLGWNEAFFFQGASDYSVHLTVNSSMDFIEAAGGLPKIIEYNHKLAINGMNLLHNKYNLQPMTTNESQVGAMFNIKLPLDFGNPKHDAIGASLSKTLEIIKNYSGYAFSHNKSWWIRLSANIFIGIDDFDKLGKVLLDTVDEEKEKANLNIPL